MLALLLNGLSAAHAAVVHALMQMPVAHAAGMAMHETGMVMEGTGMAMEKGDCHDMAMPDAEAGKSAPADAPAADSTPHKGMACCQGSLCNCACALQMPVSFSAIAVHAHGQSVQPSMVTNSYRSIDLSLILRPPIA